MICCKAEISDVTGGTGLMFFGRHILRAMSNKFILINSCLFAFPEIEREDFDFQEGWPPRNSSCRKILVVFLAKTY